MPLRNWIVPEANREAATMGWIWTDDDDDGYRAASRRSSSSSSSRGDEGHYSTRKIVKSRCRTEEVQPGKFLRKCEKIEEIFKDCAGRPTEVVQSNKEYTEEDVTDQMAKGSFSLESPSQFNFPDLLGDMGGIERSFLGGLDSFFKAAEEMKDGFFSVFGPPGTLHTYEGNSSSATQRRDTPMEGREERHPKSSNSDGEVDLSGLARDV